MKKNDPVGQHYLPIAYQSAFTIDEKIARLDVGTGVVRRFSPKVVGLENHLLTIRHESVDDPYALERFLAKIDGNYKWAIKNLVPDVFPSQDDFSAILHFVVWQMVRVPSYQREAAEFVAQYGAKFKEGSPEFEAIQTMDAKQDVALPTTIDFTRSAFEHLKFHDWSFIEAPENASFITSDRPVVVYSPKHWDRVGFGGKGIYKYFPLTPKYALVMKEGKTDHTWGTATKDRVDYLNLRVAHTADRYIFGAGTEELNSLANKSKGQMRIEAEILNCRMKSIYEAIGPERFEVFPSGIQMWRVEDSS